MSDKNKKDKKASVGEMERKCHEYLSGWKRAQADYHNLEKQTEKKREEWIKMANSDLLMELLPIYDNLKLAIEHIPGENRKSDWVIGVQHIKNQMTKFLEDMEVEEITPLKGDRFDIEVHEAIKADKGGDKIKEVLKHGYKLNGKVLYPAKVIV